MLFSLYYVTFVKQIYYNLIQIMDNTTTGLWTSDSTAIAITWVDSSTSNTPRYA